MSTDVDALKRLIRLPGAVQRCDWQTGPMAAHGTDWWLAAVLDVVENQMPDFLLGTPERLAIQTPPGLALSGAFASLKSSWGAPMGEGGRVSATVEAHSVAPYAASPLLRGVATRLSSTQVLVLLFTS